MNGNPHNINEIVAASAKAAEQVKEFAYKFYDKCAAEVAHVEDLIDYEARLVYSDAPWCEGSVQSMLRMLYKLSGRVDALYDLNIMAKQTHKELQDKICDLVTAVLLNKESSK